MSIGRNMRTPEDNWLKAKRRRAAARQNWRCHWCGLPMNEIPNDPFQVSLEHLVPRYCGGVTRPGTYVAAHRKCNSERHPELNRGKATGSAIVATTGEFETPSPFAVLLGKIR
jgi:5-methylcytosine-specific restriction endonuclease McrA